MLDLTDEDLKTYLSEDDLSLTTECAGPAHESLRFFFNTFFAEGLFNVEGNFVAGEHLNEWCDRYQKQLMTATLSARLHAKSTVIYAFLLWLIFNMDTLPGLFPEVIYISYTDMLAGYHIQKIKRLIDNMTCFQGYKSLSDAESILKMKKGNKVFSINPAGIFSVKRGIHTIGVIVDDPLQDPQKMSMDLAQIFKVTNIFNEQIASIKKKAGFIHVAGTAQDKEDLFFQLKKNIKYDWKEYPAILNNKKKQVLWPEMFPYNKLIDIRDNEIGQKAFSKEFMCAPVRGVDSFFKEEDIDNITGNCYNVDWRKYKTSNPVYGGLDIGKKMHPSHLALFEAVPVLDKDGNETEEITAKQILSLFLEKWDYTKQLALCVELINLLGIEGILFDNTRAEFDTFEENGELPSEMEGLVMSAKSQQSLATGFDQIVSSGKIELVKDDRQKRQILAVDNDLKAPTTFEGHGDAFWSIALALKKMKEGQPNMRWLGAKGA